VRLVRILVAVNYDGQSFKREMMLSTLSAVRSERSVSASNLLLATWMARSTGTFVNNDTTSKDTSTSPGPKHCEETKDTNSLEFRTAEGDFPTKGEMMATKNLERWLKR